MNRLILALAFLLAAVVPAVPAGQKVSPIEVKDCGADRVRAISSTGLITCGSVGVGSGDGDVVGPGIATDGNVVLFDGTTGKLVKNSTIAGSGVLVSGGALGTPASGDASNLTNIPVANASGILPAANGGAGTVNGIMKANGSGLVSAAASGTDYAPATSGSAALKGNGSGGFGNAACADLSDDGTACTASTGTSGATLGLLNANKTDSGNNTHTGTNTFSDVQGNAGNAGTLVSATTYTFVSGDCGKTVVFTSGSAVTATIPSAIVPAFPVTCAFAVLQAGTAKVSVNGSAVAAATLVSDGGFTGTSGTAGNMIGLTLITVSGTAKAFLSGAGS